MSINDIKKIEGQHKIDFPYYSGEVFLRKTFNNKKRLRPFVKSGFGISGIDRGFLEIRSPLANIFQKHYLQVLGRNLELPIILD